MKKVFVVLALVAAVLIAGCNSEEFAKRQAWNDACRLSQTDCKSWRPPQIKTSERVKLARAYGIYVPGTHIIWIRSSILQDLSKVEAYAVVVHEMVHYIDWKTGRLPSLSTIGEACASEKRAFDVYNELVTELGHPEYRRDAWILGYPQCMSGGPKGRSVL